MKVIFQVGTALIVVAIAIGAGAMVWSATQDHGLVIQPIAVPPDLAARGYTGDVVAARILDGLNGIDTRTISQRASSTYLHYWDNDIKVDIPDTGISVGEFNRFLHSWLGHQTTISGAIVHDGGKLTATVRTSDGASRSVAIAPENVGGSLLSVAEAIYGETQPYRYGVYLRTQHRDTEAAKVFRAITNGSPENPDTAWGIMGYANWLHDAKGLRPAVEEGARALAVSPYHFIARQNMCQFDEELGHFETAIGDCRKGLQDLARSDRGQTSEKYAHVNVIRTQGYVDSMTGSFDTELAAFDYVQATGNGAALTSTSARQVQAAVGVHDIRRAKRDYKLSDPSMLVSPRGAIDNLGAKMLIDTAREDWAAVAADPVAVEPVLAQWPGLRDMMPERVVTPLAYAIARAGDLQRARRLIGSTAPDCYPCLVTRGRIEAIARNWPLAAHWFSLAKVQSPSPPFADAEWGRMLLAKGDLDAAIAKFTIANQKGPHFADPLEMWGEALIAKNRSDLALAKFEEAKKYAPNWGRLHLKWGEALLWSGDKVAAQKQFATAAHLDLTQGERGELGRMRGMHV